MSISPQPNEQLVKKELLCIITVSKDDPHGLSATIASITSLLDEPYQHIIKVHGNSVDSYIEDPSIDSYLKRPSVKLILGPDDGIYDAMNQALLHANAEFSMFVNSGDTIQCRDTVTILSHILEASDCIDHHAFPWTYIISNHQYTRIPSSVNSILQFMPFCHQAVISRTSRLKARPFMSQYRYLADWQFFIYEYLDGARFLIHTNPSIVIFDTGGVSSIRSISFLKESLDIYFQHSGLSIGIVVRILNYMTVYTIGFIIGRKRAAEIYRRTLSLLLAFTKRSQITANSFAFNFR